MKKKVKLICIVLVLVCSIAAVAWKYWMLGENIRFAKKLGVGINIGNSLDATNLWDYKPEASELSYETFWNNPPVRQEHFEVIYQAGFRSVRIPVTWEDHLDADGKISEVWFERVQDVVDMALAENLYVILNTHHEEWLDLQLESEAEITEEFEKVWTQIAIRFREYDEHLLFEGMNEPRVRGSEHEWDSGTPELRMMVNRLNDTFVDAVRKTGGNNVERYLLVTPYASNNLEEALTELSVPKGHIIVSVHAYLPYEFCQKEDGTSDWSEENPKDRERIEETFAQIGQIFVKKNIPVILTEMGCTDKNNTDDRVAWTNFYMQEAAKNGISCMWWDNGSSYMLLDREKGTWKYPEIVETLVNGNR